MPGVKSAWTWTRIRAMAPVSLNEVAVWLLPVVGGWVVMEFAVHPLILVAFAVPFMMGLIPKLYVFILLLTRGVDKVYQTHTPSHTLSLTHSLSLTDIHTHTLSHTHSRSLSLTHTLALSHTLSTLALQERQL